MSRPLAVIAREIKSDWRRPSYGSKPYITAMGNLGSINDSYGCDSAREIIHRFLANASLWRGEVARRVKAELKLILK